jgi:hypothetical protein
VAAGRRDHARPQNGPGAVWVVWEHAGEELLDARAIRWSGRSVFVTPIGMWSRNGALGV